MAKAAQLLKDATVFDAKKENDTIRLWENYRDQALLWRALALIQMLITFATVIFAMVVWFNREIILNVPAKPLPGMYAVQEIPDTEYIDEATNFLNLIATYQPSTARRQFDKAAEMIREPLYTRFRNEMMETEVRTIETTSRTQIFFADPTKTQVIREDDEIHVIMVGDRQKIVAGKEVPPVLTKYELTMTTVPQNVLNPYGIVITNVAFENVKDS